MNYDVGATMRFVSAEKIRDIPVYHYRSDYSDSVVDQTSSLTDLPLVPEERGVVLEPKLEVWIEPYSGFLLKYKDETIASYYDIESGEELFPWNKFSNMFDALALDKTVQIAEGKSLYI